jgi:ABC-type multidrug transport system fused ATPase/permease subunit
MIKLHKAANEIPNVTVWSLLWSHVHILVFSVLLIGVNRAAGLVWPYLSKYLIDDVVVRQSQSMLLTLIAAGALATLVQGVTAYLITRTTSLSALRLLADLRKRIHQHVSRLPVAYYDANKTGALVSRVMSDVEGVRNILGGGFVAFLGAIATACIAFTILTRIEATLTLVIFLVLLPFGLIVRNRLRKYRPLIREANTIRAEVTGRLTESFGGVRVVKAYRAESHEHEVFASGVDHLLQKVLVNAKASAFLDLTIVMVTGAIGAAVMYFGGNAIMAGKMTVGDFLRYIMFLSVLVSPLIQAVSIGTQFNEAFAGLERVREILAQPREDEDPHRSIRSAQIKGDVCFQSVSFAYGDNTPVLHDVTFLARPGTMTALVGPSGAGKSTITALIAGFYKASDGAIFVDDVDLSQADLASYRAHLGVVPQDPFLFSGTIRDNVAFGRPNATDEEIIQACTLANVDEFATRFENSYQTIVGERGIKLSMGQRQRVALARAILANPRILILDEATSSLDSISEATIQEALTFLLQDRTTFVIAHRLSTIRRADQILVIDDGRIVECGTHESLFRNQGKYWQLYTMQHELQSNLFLAPGEGVALADANPEPSYPSADAAS